MHVRRRQVEVMVLFVCFVWFLIATLEPAARSGWLGPVVAESLERGFDAGALFYTEVNLTNLNSATPRAQPDTHVQTIESRERAP